MNRAVQAARTATDLALKRQFAERAFERAQFAEAQARAEHEIDLIPQLRNHNE